MKITKRTSNLYRMRRGHLWRKVLDHNTIPGILNPKSFLILICILLFWIVDIYANAFWVRTFKPWDGYAIPNGLWLTGDFNADGQSDIVHAVRNTDYVHVWMSRGDGRFNVSTFRPWSGYAIPNGLWRTGDFNGDGKTDIVHAVKNRDYVHVWLSRGNGTFRVTTFRPWSGYAIPNGLWMTGDFNGDGKSDIVHAVRNTDYVHVWTSRGNGTFSVGTFRPWGGYAIPNGLWRTGDFNADGKTDIVHAVKGRDYVHVWTSKGNATFSVGTFRPWTGYAIPNGLWMTGDFNGDGKSDIVHAVRNRDYVHVWTSRGNGTFSVGTFRPWGGYAIPNGLWRTGDFDGDGKADIVHAVKNTNYVHVWRSRGNGTFNVTTFSPWSSYAIPNGLWLTGDITGDGKTDIVHAVNNRDYVHPWISTLPAPGEISLDGLEITQAVQDMRHSVPLIANKQTVARAYLSYNGTSPMRVRGQLFVRKWFPFGSTATTTINSMNTVIINPVQNDQIRPKRENVNASLNFALPSSVESFGGYIFKLSSVTNTVTNSSQTCSDCPTSTVGAWIRNSAPLRVRVIGLRYTTGTPPTTYRPSLQDYRLINSWFRRAYPIGQLIASRRTVNASNTWPFTCGQANAQIAAIRSLDVAGGMDARTHYYGLVSDGGGFMRGCASGIPSSANPAVVASGPTGSSTWGWDGDGSYGDWYTGHELGHTLGRFHIGSGCGESSDDPNYPFPSGQLSDADGTFVGFDTGDPVRSIPMSALPGVNWHDVMSYCDYQWLSSYTYQNVMDRLNDESALAPGAPVLTMTGLATKEPVAGVAPGDTLPILEDGPPELAAVKSSLAQKPETVVGYENAPDIKTGLQAAPKLGQPAMTAPQLPDPEIWGEGYIPEPAMPSPPKIQQGFIMAPIKEAPKEAQTLAAPPEQDQTGVKSGDFLSVIATVNLTETTGKIQFVNRVSSALVSEVDEQSQARLRLTDANGKVIGEYPVLVNIDTDIPPGEDKTGLVNAIIPFDASTSLMELILSDTVIDSRRASKNAPKVETVTMPSAESLQAFAAAEESEQVPLEFSWQGSDLDGDELTYNVQISSDSGNTWQTIAVGLTSTTLTLEPEELQELKSMMIRVIANDGFNSSVVTSDTINIRQP